MVLVGTGIALPNEAATLHSAFPAELGSNSPSGCSQGGGDCANQGKTDLRQCENSSQCHVKTTIKERRTRLCLALRRAIPHGCEAEQCGFCIGVANELKQIFVARCLMRARGGGEDSAQLERQPRISHTGCF